MIRVIQVDRPGMRNPYTGPKPCYHGNCGNKANREIAFGLMPDADWKHGLIVNTFVCEECYETAEKMIWEAIHGGSPAAPDNKPAA